MGVIGYSCLQYKYNFWERVIQIAQKLTDELAYDRTDGHGYIDSSSDADKEYVYFMGSETSPLLSNGKCRATACQASG